jgi:hypothetical protein
MRSKLVLLVVGLVLSALCVTAAVNQIPDWMVEYGVPAEWEVHTQANYRLWSKSLVSISRNHQPDMPLLIPSIGNGYLATVVGSPTVFIGGLFSGKNENGIEMTAASHRARIPAYLNINTTQALVDYTSTSSEGAKVHHPGGFAIDVRQGVFYERLFVRKSPEVRSSLRESNVVL